MSWSPCPDPVPGDRASAEAIEMLIIPRAVACANSTGRSANSHSRQIDVSVVALSRRLRILQALAVRRVLEIH